MVVMTSGFPQPTFPAELNPYNKLPNPTDERTKESLSSRKSTFSFRSLNKIKPRTKQIMEIGAIKVNKARQLKCWIIQPERVGPIAGANVKINPRKPIIVHLLEMGKLTNKTFINKGINMAEPDACNIRPNNKNEKTGATAATIVPIVNKPIDVKNNPRTVYFCIK